MYLNIFREECRHSSLYKEAAESIANKRYLIAVFPRTFCWSVPCTSIVTYNYHDFMYSIRSMSSIAMLSIPISVQSCRRVLYWHLFPLSLGDYAILGILLRPLIVVFVCLFNFFSSGEYSQITALYILVLVFTTRYEII